MLNLSGKVRLGKVYLSSNYNDCHNVKVFSQGPLKLTFADIFVMRFDKFLKKIFSF